MKIHKKVLAAAAKWREEWTRFFQEVFGLAVDLSAVAVPKRRGFGWMVFAVPGLTLEDVFAKCASRFPSRKCCGDLDKGVPENERDPNRGGVYSVRFRARVEADEENKGLSADTIKKSGSPRWNITLLERMLLELWYHWKTRNHLDTSTWTICCGSRHGDGGVPRAYWSGREFKVFWCSPHAADPGLCTREAAVSQAA